MIKRFGAFFIGLLYLVTVTGFALNLHFCCNDLTSVTIGQTVKNSSACKMAGEKCCTDKRLVVKIADAHYGGHVHLTAKTLVVNAPVLNQSHFLLNRSEGFYRQFFDKRPPDPPVAGVGSIIIKNRVFRI